ncbi:MAG: hypothetical protein IJX25_01890, partial [Clostridia bacterium]|nr:hypothetical protein [Clostridia bacterium]
MKLEVYQGSTIFQSARYMLSKIDNSDFLTDNVVIVPDKYSLLTEKMVLDLSQGGSLFNIRVKTLSSFSLELMQKLGLEEKGVISSGESLLLTQMAIENVKKDFTLFKKSNINFCYEINKLISQFKSSCIDAEELNNNAQGVTGHKYHDLALIYNEYQRLLGDKLDANERLKLIKNSLAGKNLLANTKIYFAHFEAFTKEAFDFVRVLFEEAGLVALSLAYPQSIGNDYIYEKDLQGKFEKLANEYGQNVDIFVCDNPLLPAQEAITRGLYSYEKVKTNNEGYYNIYGGGSITAEVESVAKLIRYYVYKGSSYRDFQIAIGALGKYQQTVEDIFDKYKIPFYIDSTITADQTILGNFIIEFFTTFVTGFGRDNLIDFFSNILVKEKELVKLCQTYAVEGRGRYKQFIEEQNPFAEEFGLLEKAKKAQDFSHVVINLCNKIQDRYDDVLERLRDNGDLKEYNINRQMFEILVGCTQLIEQYSFEEMDSGEYLKKLKLLLSFKQVSSVPTYLDSVMLGDATQS